MHNAIAELAADGCNVYIAVAFFTESSVVESLIANGCHGRLVFRLGFPTNPAALQKLMELSNVEVRYFTGHSFHPKIYIFGEKVALVGSANLTGAALLSNQEVVVSVDSNDPRLTELATLFSGYWSEAKVLDQATLIEYRSIFQQSDVHQNAIEKLGAKVLERFGEFQPSNIARGKPKVSEESIFLEHDPSHCDHANFIRARSCTMEEMQSYATSLNLVRPTQDTSSDPHFGLQHWYPRIWDEWARDKDGVVPDEVFTDDEESVDLGDSEQQEIRIPSVMPAFAQKYAYGRGHRCANEIAFRFYGQKEYLAEVFPKSPGREYLRAIGGGVSLGDWRVGRSGLVNLIKWRDRTTRRLLSAEQVVFGWLSDRGWRPTLSPPGILAKQIYKQVHGHVGVAIREPVISLLEHMNGGKPDHPTISSATKNETDEGRELAIAKVKSILGQIDSPRDLHEYLVSIGAFRLGLRVQCPECMRRSWFDLESIGATFKCPKCLNTFDAIGNVDRAPWCYKAAGPFSVKGYEDGAYAVLRSIDFFDDQKMNTMRASPVVSFTAEGIG